MDLDRGLRAQIARTLDVGWVPDGLGGASMSVRPDEQQFGAFDTAHVNGGPDIGLSITVLSRGRGVEELPTGASGLPRGAVPRPTDPVRGGPAECLSDPLVPAGTCTALRWEYAPDAWAQVSYGGQRRSDARGRRGRGPPGRGVRVAVGRRARAAAVHAERAPGRPAPGVDPGPGLRRRRPDLRHPLERHVDLAAADPDAPRCG